MEPQLSTTPPVSSRKKWMIIGGTVALVLILVAVGVWMLTPKTKEQPAQPDGQTVARAFTFGAADKPVMYAGQSVYDACNLISFDTVKAGVKDFEKTLSVGMADGQAESPLVIAHNYFDRDMPSPLGRDGSARPKGMLSSGAQLQASNFISSFDSSCWYGRGQAITVGSGTAFVKLYVTQPPTPLSPEFLAYLDSLSKVGSENGVDAYVEPTADGGGFATMIFAHRAKNIIVVLKTGSVELTEPAVNEVIAALQASPKGAMSVEYPKPWQVLPNACLLLTADDFERFTGKPASALAEEEVRLTEDAQGQMERHCQRLETERAGEISETSVIARSALSVEDATTYLENLKGNERDSSTMQPLSQIPGGIDEAYIKTEGLDKPRAYELIMRKGALIVSVNVETETGLDASTDAYMQRMLPVANQVAQALA